MNDTQPTDSSTINRKDIASGAALISLGNIASRLLGLIRETVIADIFGATGAVSAFRVASSTYNLLYELLIGGMVTSAFVPVLSEYADKDRQEFRSLLGALAGALTAAIAVIVLLLELAAPILTWLMSAGFPDQLRSLTTELIRTSLPAVLLMSLAGLASASLYALKRVAYPAFMAAVFNTGIIVCTIIFAGKLDVLAITVGVLIGALSQLILQGIGLWRNHTLPKLHFYHPAFKRIALLALPVLASLVIGQAQVIIDRNLASRTGEQSMAWMANATTLIQFPLGLVAAAISLASLPQLSRLAAPGGDRRQFISTLSFSLRLVIVLILPAVAVLLVLGTPLIRLLFEHGQFTAADTVATAAALRIYLIGLPFAALDQCLIFAFYAKSDTLRPAIVGAVGVGIYLATALLTIGRWGMLGLVAANSAQWFGHCCIMVVLTLKQLGDMKGQGLFTALKQSLLASLAALLATFIALKALSALPLSGIWAELLTVGGGAVVIAIVYMAIMLQLKNEDFRALLKYAQARLPKV